MARMARDARRQLVSHELLEHSARLFAERGYSGTSLQDIADAMGISRPAIYHYVSGKEDLLAALVHDVLDRVVVILSEARGRTDLDAAGRVSLALSQIIVNNAGNRMRFRLLDRSEPDLPKEVAALHRSARRRVLSLFTEMVEEAQSAGQVRPLPAKTAALALLGMANWVAWWYRPNADGDPAGVAEVLVSLAMDGLRRPDERRVDAGPLGALAMLKEDLAHLEQLLAASPNLPEVDAPPD